MRNLILKEIFNSYFKKVSDKAERELEICKIKFPMEKEFIKLRECHECGGDILIAKATQDLDKEPYLEMREYHKKTCRLLPEIFDPPVIVGKGIVFKNS